MRNLLRVGLLLALAAPIGCFPSTSTNDKSASSTPSADEATPRETIGKTTQNVLDLEQALRDGAELASTKVESKNPLMISADAYRTSVGKIGGMGVEQAIQLRNAQSIQDPKPLTYDVFMAEIIKKGQPDGIRLPMLPYYQEYTWDKKNQKLVVVDFPARIEEREKQR
ncbi:hypothetical protein [Aporhodopirellula aestuarii]|uniref:Lipoprotein n=1 Tax=Aporhodopirellula aestuarii TaxID=2950107 RepID=A0ABT0UEH4_9BACT|nr:hypothetical protein [Aporhodopirellula aestuarii]MCM2375288.1 hypothetical protein [Aporhodopirellula aestuarii]